MGSDKGRGEGIIMEIKNNQHARNGGHEHMIVNTARSTGIRGGGEGNTDGS